MNEDQEKKALALLEDLAAFGRIADRAERWSNSPPEMQPLYHLIKEVEAFLKQVKSENNGQE